MKERQCGHFKAGATNTGCFLEKCVVDSLHNSKDLFLSQVVAPMWMEGKLDNSTAHF